MYNEKVIVISPPVIYLESGHTITKKETDYGNVFCLRSPEGWLKLETAAIGCDAKKIESCKRMAEISSEFKNFINKPECTKMTVLVAKNEKETLNLSNAKGFRLSDGDRLIISSVKEIEDAGEWIGIHGISGVYFDPAGETDEYKDFMFVSAGEDDPVAIRLFN